MKKIIRSNRLYKDKIKISDNELLQEDMRNYNEGLRYAYIDAIKESYGLKSTSSVHMRLKAIYTCNDYYANNIKYRAAQILSSSRECHKLNVASKKAKIKNIQNQIKKEESKLKSSLKMLEQVVKVQQGIKFKFKATKGWRVALSYKDNIPQFTFLNRDKSTHNIYDFDVQLLKPSIKRCRNKIKMLKYGLARQEEKLNKLESKVKYSCFGGSKLFKSQFTTYKDNHQEWKELYDKARNNRMLITGSKAAKQGNFVFRLSGRELTIKSMRNNKITLHHVRFPSDQALVESVLFAEKENRTAVAWEVEDKGDYYIISVIIELPKQEVNFSKVDGIIGLDINADHFALSNISEDGNLLDSKIIHFDLRKKSTNQAKHILGNAVKEVLAYCVEKNKPLGMENLNTEKSKQTLQYGNKKRNQILSSFAYQKMITALESRAYKDKVGIYKVNPAYTSAIGKLKYMKKKGISIHSAASYTVGRRALGYHEKIPSCYQRFINENNKDKHSWARWNIINKEFKNQKMASLYQCLPYQIY